MRTIIFFTLALGCLQDIYGQNKLPAVPKAQASHIEIKGTYTPRDKFLSMFPGFGSGGVYLFDLENSIGPDPERYNNYDRTFYRGLYKFNSNEFPAVEVKSSRTLATLGKILVQFTTDCDLNKIFFSKMRLSRNGNSWVDMTSKTDFEFSGSARDAEQLKERSKYNLLNNIYKESVNAILAKSNAQILGITDIGTLEIPDQAMAAADVVLQFVYVQSNVWARGKTSDLFPSHALYKLIVKNIYGEIIGSYGQAIFMEADGYDNLKQPLAIITTLPVAVENLVSRFLNDSAAVQKIVTLNEEEKVVRKSIEHYDSLYSYKRAYNVIRSKKQQLLFDLYPINDNYDDLAGSNKDREEAVTNRDRSMDNNLMTSLIYGSSYGGWSRFIQKGLEANKRKLFMLEQKAFLITAEEKNFINDVSLKFQQPFDLAFIFESKELEDRIINLMFTKLSNKKSETFEAFTNTSKTLSNDFGSVLTNNITSFFKELDAANKTSITPVVETSGMTNGGSTAKNMDACQQRATAEAYKSAEYNNWMRTKLHADASDYKAKVIELTLEYCGDKLPASEVQMLRQTAANERKVAREIRASAKNALHF